MKSSVRYTRGVGIIEVVVSIGLLTTVFVGFFGVLQLSTRLATDNKSKTTALSLALERMEYIRSLDYNDVGTLGGNPSGIINVSESVTLNGVGYTVVTYIVYFDDPQDGIGAEDTNGITNDYKVAKATVQWNGKTGQRQIVLVSNVAPIGIEE